MAQGLLGLDSNRMMCRSITGAFPVSRIIKSSKDGHCACVCHMQS